MNSFTFLTFFLIVVGIPVIGGVWSSHQRQKMRLRERELEVLGTQTAEKAAQYAAQTERLEQRVRVLERIVTDKGLDLASEIDRLRGDDEPRRLDH
ncbi:hypothetical protein [Sphingobium nicotianae]|uniref:Phage shock protein B n=1 Tax=Sphingobium nicotianae TaxID=2782607 RepID=A0A9X1DG40_9SPHN|nr:hypothetical protein [Sphingobium nicotianae]MBT2188868.1 hypothetical protein [Sphingobium nicotianae]